MPAICSNALSLCTSSFDILTVASSPRPSPNLKNQWDTSVAPGNVLLEKGEANLSKQSVVNITQIFTVDRADLSERIGTLSRERMKQVLDGILLLMGPRNIEE